MTCVATASLEHAPELQALGLHRRVDRLRQQRVGQPWRLQGPVGERLDDARRPGRPGRPGPSPPARPRALRGSTKSRNTSTTSRPCPGSSGRRCRSRRRRATPPRRPSSRRNPARQQPGGRPQQRLALSVQPSLHPRGATIGHARSEPLFSSSRQWCGQQPTTQEYSRQRRRVRGPAAARRCWISIARHPTQLTTHGRRGRSKFSKGEAPAPRGPSPRAERAATSTAPATRGPSPRAERAATSTAPATRGPSSRAERAATSTAAARTPCPECRCGRLWKRLRRGRWPPVCG